MSTLRRSLAGLVLFAASTATAGAVLWGALAVPSCGKPPPRGFDAELAGLRDGYLAEKQALLAEARAAVLAGDRGPSDRLGARGRAVHARHRAEVRALCRRHGRPVPAWARD